jgi:hypothetical protein
MYPVLFRMGDFEITTPIEPPDTSYPWLKVCCAPRCRNRGPRLGNREGLKALQFWLSTRINLLLAQTEPDSPVHGVGARAEDSIGKRKRFLGFTFERESHWMLVLYVLVPLTGILLSIVIPGLGRRWFP